MYPIKYIIMLMRFESVLFFVFTFLLAPVAVEPCSLPADTEPCDGSVSITELTDYINQWYACSSCCPGLMDAIAAYYEPACTPDCSGKECGPDGMEAM